MPILATQNAAAADNWLAQNAISGTPPLPPFPGGRTVAVVSRSRAVAYTDDGGANWILTAMPVLNNWFNVAYGAGVFVALAVGSAIAATSTNGGVSWTQRTLPRQISWRSAAYGDGVWIAVGYRRYGAISTDDGASWADIDLGNGNWDSIIYDGTQFVAVSHLSTIAVTSPDGVTWTQRTLPEWARWQRVLYLQDRLFVHATDGKTAVSTDSGVSWTTSTSLPVRSLALWLDSAYSPTLGSGQGRLVIIDADAVSSNPIVYSDDQGQSWTETSTPIGSDLDAITWTGSAFIIVGHNTDVAFASTDGITWIERTMPATLYWTDIATAIEP